MGVVSLAKHLTPGNVAMVNGLATEFSNNPVLMDMLEKFKGVDATQAYARLMTLSDAEMMALARAIGRINATMKGATKR